MFDVIVAVDENYGIGKNGTIPWKHPEDLNWFKRNTMECNLIIGRKTYDSLPRLPGRKLYVVSRTRHSKISDDDMVAYCGPLDGALKLAEASGVMTFVAGGQDVYDQVLTKYINQVCKVIITRIPGIYDCDRFLGTSWHSRFVFKPNFEITLSDTVKVAFYLNRDAPLKRAVSLQPPESERQYLSLLKDVITNGSLRIGRNGKTRSVFGRHLTFDLTRGFPLMTTRRVFWRGIIEELLFFLRGDTDSNILEAKNVNIWKGNTTQEFLTENGLTHLRPGLMGPMYGYQWRSFGAQYNEDSGRPCTESLPSELGLEDGIDQLAEVVHLIKNDPNSRRILMTTYNPGQAKDGVLYPCHSIILQFYVDGDFLDAFVYNRSQDLALGTPFNIASSSLLLLIVAKMTEKTGRHLHMSMGDAHIYEEHLPQIRQLLTRTPHQSPTVVISKSVLTLEDIPNLTPDDFLLSDYKFHPAIKMEMVA